MNMQELKQDLIRDESLETELYRCSSQKLTIGVGRNLQDNGITEDEAMYLLENDINRCIKELKTLDWFDDAPECVKRGLINMNFNMGWLTLQKFKKMLNSLEQGFYQNAAIEALDSRWAAQVGKRAERIAELFRQAV